MNWTEKKNVSELWDYIMDNHDEKPFAAIDRSVESYWESFNNENNICEYCFSDIIEMKDKMPGSIPEEFRTLSSIVSYKERIEDIIESEIHGDDQIKRTKIPDFVYTF